MPARADAGARLGRGASNSNSLSLGVRRLLELVERRCGLVEALSGVVEAEAGAGAGVAPASAPAAAVSPGRGSACRDLALDGKGLCLLHARAWQPAESESEAKQTGRTREAKLGERRGVEVLVQRRVRNGRRCDAEAERVGVDARCDLFAELDEALVPLGGQRSGWDEEARGRTGVVMERERGMGGAEWGEAERRQGRGVRPFLMHVRIGMLRDGTTHGRPIAAASIASTLAEARASAYRRDSWGRPIETDKRYTWGR
ncbi:hypothetical protein FRC06_006149 [Ceratobasidium sp. 370]|nr:hypothetical protein FRC06_006149 [Ceratobasidium sp. 370]